MNLFKKSTGKLVSEYFMIVLGSLIYAVGLTIFIKPTHISMGGVAGVALIFNYLWKLPVGIVSIVLNVPLIAIGYKMLGKEFFFKTAVATVSASVFIDALGPFLPQFQDNLLLATLYGGIIMGAGFGLVFRAGGTSGGTDVIAKYLFVKHDIALGTTNLVSNGVIIAISALVYRSFESALYAIIVTYLTGVVIDQIIYGADVQKNALIITSKPKEISDSLMAALGHGVTALDGKGMYTGNQRTVLITVVRRHETGTVKSIIHQVDDSAFLILSNVSEVFGQGFKKYGQ